MKTKENKIKKFGEEHKTAKAVMTGLAIGVAIGGAVIYAKTSDARKLWNLLNEYDRDNKGETLVSKLFEYANGADYAQRIGPTITGTKTVAELGEAVDYIMKASEAADLLSDEVVGMVLFTKSSES